MEPLISLFVDGAMGIFTGVLTALLLFAVKRFWVSDIYPFVERTRYSGVQIDGKWEGYGADAEGGSSTEFVLLLKQSALALSGSAVLKHDSDRNSFELHFNVTGRIWEGYVILNFAPSDRRVTSYATGMLKISGGGSSLVGQLAFRNVFREEVTAEPVILAQAEPRRIRGKD